MIHCDPRDHLPGALKKVNLLTYLLSYLFENTRVSFTWRRGEGGFVLSSRRW